METLKMLRHKARLFLGDRRAYGYVETIIAFAIIMVLIWGFLSVTPIVTTKLSIDYMATRLTRVIEISGEVGDDYAAELSSLKSQTKINPSVSVSTTYVTGNKIQLRQKIIVTISTDVRVNIFTPAFGQPVSIVVPVSKTVTGMSEVYWKT